MPRSAEARARACFFPSFAAPSATSGSRTLVFARRERRKARTDPHGRAGCSHNVIPAQRASLLRTTAMAVARCFSPHSLLSLFLGAFTPLPPRWSGPVSPVPLAQLAYVLSRLPESSCIARSTRHRQTSRCCTYISRFLVTCVCIGDWNTEFCPSPSCPWGAAKLAGGSNVFHWPLWRHPRLHQGPHSRITGSPWWAVRPAAPHGRAPTR